MSGMMGAIALRGLATLGELQTFYSFEDALNMLEMIRVAHHNERAARNRARQLR